MRKVYYFLILFFVSVSTFGQFSLILPGTYTQDFNGLGINTSTGVTGGNLNIVNTSLIGWFFSELPTSDLQITAGTGSSTTGDTYNFGTSADADRTLGGLRSGALNPTIGFYFTNNTGSIITSLAISYTGEQWRLGVAGRLDRIDFEYSLNATSLTTGNWVNADAFDFTAPVTTGPIGALDGNVAANRTVITNTLIGLAIPNAATCFIRWTDFVGTGSDDGLGIDDFSLTANFTAPSTDHFRSVQTGSWNDLTTWESSSDAITWVAATSIPTSDANTITIRNTHTVTFASFLSVDQVVIQNGGILDYSNGILTVNDGVGNDIDIQNNGVFVLSLDNSPPIFGSGNPIINITTGAILRASAVGLTAAAPTNGVNVSNYVYQHQSILEVTTSGFSSLGVTFFPNVNATTIPIFRTTSSSAILVGASTNTTFNGIFEANGSGLITWQNSGNKIFRNGIKGTGNITANASAANAKFIINGTTAELGGSGSLTVPTTGGLEIGNPTTVTMNSDKVISGNVILINTNSLIELGNFNLTVTGTISITDVSSYVRTNGTGKLTLPITIPGIIGSKLFPIGVTTINPLFIQSTLVPTNYSARVVQPITPPIYNDLQAVLRTWYITSSVIAPGATIGFGYSFTPIECGPLYNNSGPVEVGVNITGTWNIHQLNNVPVAFFIPGTFIVTPSVPISYFNGPANEFPFVIANNGAVLPLDYFITANAQKINNKAIINWLVFDEDNVNSFEVQRSVNNGNFQTIAILNPVNHQLDYGHTDEGIAKGINLYRIKVNLLNGGLRYSNMVAVINDTKGLLITSSVPNPAYTQAMFTISAAKQGKATFQIFDLAGRVVKQWQTTITGGTNTIPVTVSELQAGVYHLVIVTQDAKAVCRFVKQ